MKLIASVTLKMKKVILPQFISTLYKHSIDINMITEDSHLVGPLAKLLSSNSILVVRSLGAAIAAAAELALGNIDIYFNPVGGKIWDFAPCAHVVNKAGGCALEIDLQNLTAKQFCPSHLRYGVLFASSKELAHKTAAIMGFAMT